MGKNRLIDLALAVKLADEAAENESGPWVYEKPSVVRNYDNGFETRDVAVTTLASIKVDFSVGQPREDEQSEDEWLPDELWERVFG